MDTKVKELLEVKKRSTVSISLKEIPIGVHKRILKYKTQITGKYQRDFNLKQAYVEFLKEAAKTI